MPTLEVAVTQEHLQQQAIQQLAIIGGQLTVEEDITFEGSKFVFPEQYKGDLDGMRDFIERYIAAQLEMISVDKAFHYRPHDGAYAVYQCLKRFFGYAQSKAKQGMFGAPPTEVTIPVGYVNSVLQEVTVPFGSDMVLPGLSKATLTISSQRSLQGDLLYLVSRCRRVNKSVIDGFYKMVDKYLAEHSIYRGHAVDGGMTYIDTDVIDPEQFVYTDKAMSQLETHILSPIAHADVLARHKLTTKRVVLLEGPFGCLAGDAEVIINRAGNARRYSMENLVHLFNGGPSKKAGRTWDPTIPSKIQYRDDEGVLRSTPIVSAWCSGMKDTFTVTAADGRQVRATAEHPFLTVDGMRPLGELRSGDRVFMRSPQASPEGTQRQRKQRSKYHSREVPVTHPYRKANNHVAEHRLVVEAEENGFPDVRSYLERLATTDVEGIKFLDPTQWHVHHLNGDSLDNRRENLDKMTPREHAARHADENTSNVLYKAHLVEITSIERFGEEMTYDLEVEAPEHNFVANGFVVSNSGKSGMGRIAAKVAHEHGWTSIIARPGVDDPFAVLQTGRLYQPAMIFVEDVDTFSSSLDPTYVTKLLDQFDGFGTKNLRMLLVLTTNHADRIHKGMLRPGRLDAVIHIGAMDRVGVEKLCRLVVGPSLDPLTDFDVVFEATRGFMPAYVREAIERAVRYTIARLGDVGPLSTDDLVNACDSLRSQFDLQERANDQHEKLPPLDQMLRQMIADEVPSSSLDINDVEEAVDNRIEYRVNGARLVSDEGDEWHLYTN